MLSPDSGGDATGSGGGTGSTGDDGGLPSIGGQTVGGTSGGLQLAPPSFGPGATIRAPLIVNTPATILSPDSGGDSTPAPEEPPTTTSPSGPPATGGDDPAPATPGGDDTSPGTSPGVAPPQSGEQGEFVPNSPSTGSGTTGLRRELGAIAGNLPFTGMLVGLLALLGLLSLAAGTTGRWATAVR